LRAEHEAQCMPEMLNVAVLMGGIPDPIV